MRSILVKKGDLVGFHRKPATEDYYDVRGPRDEILDFAAGRYTSIAKVTGTHAPVDEWYGCVNAS